MCYPTNLYMSICYPTHFLTYFLNEICYPTDFLYENLLSNISMRKYVIQYIFCMKMSYSTLFDTKIFLSDTFSRQKCVIQRICFTEINYQHIFIRSFYTKVISKTLPTRSYGIQHMHFLSQNVLSKTCSLKKCNT